MSSRLLHETLHQSLDSFKNRMSVEGLRDFFRRKNKKHNSHRLRESEIENYSVDDIPRLAPQLAKEFIEAVGEDNVPRNFVDFFQSERDVILFYFDVTEKRMDFETAVLYGLYIANSQMIFDDFLFTTNNDITSKVEENDVGVIIYDSQHLRIAVNETSDTKFEELITKYQVDLSDTKDRKREEAVVKLRNDFNDYINTLYEDVRTPSSSDSITVDYDEVADVLEPHDSIKRHPNFIFGMDDGGGNYTGLLKYDGHLISVDWDHETTAYTIK